MTRDRNDRHFLPQPYRAVLRHAAMPSLLLAFGLSLLGDGMSTVTVSWLAIEIAPHGRSGILVGLSVAAYTLPGALGALVLNRWLRRLPARKLLVADCGLRTAMLAAIPVASALHLLRPAIFVSLLGLSSLLHAWGGAAKYTLLAEYLPDEERLAGNSLLGSMGSAALIAGPAVAGLLISLIGPAWLIGFDALTFAALGIKGWRLRPAPESVPMAPDPENGSSPVGTLALLRTKPELLGLIALTWGFNLLYGPVEVALPVHISKDLGASASLLGLYWTVFGVGAILGSLGVGVLQRLKLWPALLASVALWGLLLVPFGVGAPVAATLACFAAAGLVYGPFNPLTLGLFQRAIPAPRLAAVLAAEGAVGLMAAPIGAAAGGPLTSALGAGRVLLLSGVATAALAAFAALVRVATRSYRPGTAMPDRAD